MNLTSKQMDNILDLIISICVKAESRGEITQEERDAIIQFTSNATASKKILEQIFNGEIKI
jgi:hypothetical protein